jgi:hypothetical protein
MTAAALQRGRRSTSALGILALAIVALLSVVAMPLVTPIFAAVGGALSFVMARRTSDRLCWWAFGVFLFSLVAAGVIDLGLISASSGINPATHVVAPANQGS